jgi:hypothetical protein
LVLVPRQHQAIKELLGILIMLGDRKATLELMGRLLRLDPHNPTVFDDCILFARRSKMGWTELIHMFDTLGKDYPNDRLVQANCDFYAGKVLFHTDPVSARKRIVAAQRSFRQVLPGGHHVFGALRTALRQLSPRPTPTWPSAG